MKLLRMKLANRLTKGGYADACKAAAHWEEQYRLMQDKAVKLEQALRTECELTVANSARINNLTAERDRTDRHLRIAERALIEKDGTIHRLSEGLDQIVRAGEGKIEGRKCNGSLKRVVRMAEAALYPDGQEEMGL